MRIFSTACLFILLLTTSIRAQNSLLEFAGEDYYFVECPPWCNDFELILDHTISWEEVTVYVSPSSGVSINTNSDSSYYICFDFPGTYYVIGQGLGFGPNGNDVFVSDTVIVEIYEGYPTFGEIFGPTCQDSIDRGECHQACEFSTVTYFFSGQINFGTWSVQGADSYVDNGISVEVVWGAAGNGVVEFIPETQCSTEPISICVDILPTPDPDFASIPAIDNNLIQLCLGQPVYLENLSQHASRYEWTFGDGTMSELFEPEHAYQTPGNYTITLTAFNECDDCLASTSVEVEVLPAPAPELSCVATVCPEDKVRYTATTDGCQTFHWTVSANGVILAGGGLNDDFIEIEWGQGPDGLIELLVEDCNQPYCSKPTIFRVPIVSTDGPITGDAIVCSGEIVTYKAPYFPGVTYNWSTSSLGTIISGQNTNAVSVQWAQVFAVQPNEEVSVTYGHCYLGCEGSDQFDVRIVPEMQIESDNQFCSGHDGTFTSTAGFLSQTNVVSAWRLINEDGTEVYVSATDDDEITINLNYPAGNYTMIATPANPNDVCQDYVEKDFIISPIPEIPLSIISDSFICPGLNYSFEIQNAGNYETYWTITDGGSTHNYQGQIITHTFGPTPPYIVEAAHGDLIYPACISSTISKTLYTSDGVNIVGPDENCMEETSLYFIYEVPGEIIEWRVEPSDMAEVSDKHNTEATFYWTKSGSAQVILNVCGNDIIKDVVIHALPDPVVNFPAGLCKNEVAHVSTTIDYVSQIWRDSAGVAISQDSTTPLYPGYYSVEVTDTNGCVGSKEFHIEFYPTPTARISTLGNTGHCAVVDPIELVANTDGTNYNFQWYHDAVPVGTNSPRYTATDYGVYQVEITNQYGCNVFSNIIQVFDWCDGSGGVCNGQTCNAYPCVVYGGLDYINGSIDCNTKTYEENSPVAIIPGTVNWDIEQPNGTYTRLTGDNVQFTYSDAGYYTVVLTAQVDGYAYPQPGCVHLVAFKDTVPAAARFDYHGACANAVMQFDDLSTFLPDYGITAWDWDFGDGNFSTDQHPTNIYTASGTYLVELTITSTTGCTSTFSRTIEVFSSPALSINALAEACENNPVLLEVTSSQLLFNTSWDFDDSGSSNNTATAELTYHAFSTAGMYNPEVTANNIFGCSATESVAIEIFTNNLTGDITSTNGTVLCEGELTDLISPAGGISWEWNTDEITEQITTDEAGYYDVIVEDDHGCQYAPDPIFIEIQPRPVALVNGRELFGPGDASPWSDTVETCEGVDIELQAFANSSVSYLWNTTQTTKTISFTDEGGNLLSAGIHTFSVTVTDLITNCESLPAEIHVIVHDNPQDFTISLQSGTGCSEMSNFLQVDNVEPGVTYEWSDGQVGPVIEAFEAGVYSVLATNQFGCTTMSMNFISILQSPRVDLFPSGCFIRCNPDTVCIPDIPNVSYFEIRLDNVVLDSGPNLPNELIATQSGTYELYLESFNGCSALSEALHLELYPGFGSVDVSVFVDLNNNSIIDAGDTLIENVNVWLIENNSLYDAVRTNNLGSAYFLNVPQGSYVAAIDTTSIPGNLRPSINNQLIDVVGCDLEFMDSLLLSPCLDEIFLDVALCPGDSIQLGDTTVVLNGNFTYLDPGDGIGCDTLYSVTLVPPDSGYITVNTYYDANDDGVLDAGDSLLTSIPVIFTNEASGLKDTLSSDANGQVRYRAQTGTWIVELDTALVLHDWQIILGRDTITVGQNCGVDNDISIDFLYGPGQAIVQINEAIALCPGDSVLIDGTYYYDAETVEIMVLGGPADSLFIYDITQLPEIEINEITVESCEGLDNGAVTIDAVSANGPVSISWMHTSSASFTLNDLPPNTYEYSVSDGMCQLAGELNIGEYIFPAYTIDAIDPNCPGTTQGQINISLATPELSWSLDSINYTTDNFIEMAAGTYTVYFTNGNCYQSNTVILDEKLVEPLVLDPVIDLPINTPIQLTHNYIDSISHLFEWSPSTYLSCADCALPTFSGSEEDVELFLVVTDLDGCEQEAQLLIQTDEGQHIFIPNAFSPNGDEINDYFKPFVRPGVVQTERLEIFDRWGNMVYAEGVNPAVEEIRGWDGKRYDNYHIPGLFIYKAKFVYLNGKTKEMTGEVHLMR